MNIENSKGENTRELQCTLLNKVLDSATASLFLNSISGVDSEHSNCQTEPKLKTFKTHNNYVYVYVYV